MTKNELINLLFSTSAFLVSVIVYFQSSKLNRRQLRIEKIEEMLEITHILIAKYEYFINVINLKNSIRNNLVDDLASLFRENRLPITLQELHQISKEMDLQNKLIRLFILNNSYLPKIELKDKIEVFITLYASIADKTLSTSLKKISYPFKQFPTPLNFSDFTTEIQNELIEEMGLGYKNSIQLKNTYVKRFKERYKL